jgi:perosamine synthetase
VIPPIAVPVSSRGIVSAFLARGAPHEPGFGASLAEATGFSHVALYGSGRAALAAYLQTLPRGGRDEVVVPAYTCWTVPAAVVRSGWRVRIVDVDPITLDYDAGSLERADASKVAAVVAAHLFSRTCDVQRLRQRFRGIDSRIRVIEDCAQTWPLADGPHADAVLLSFGRGKPIALGGGGAVLLDGEAPGLGLALSRGGLTHLASLMATALIGGPRTYRIPASIPALGIGATIYDPGFDRDEPLRAWQGRLGVRELRRLPGYRRARQENAAVLIDALRGLPSGWRVLGAAAGDGPIRLPVLGPSAVMRDRALRELERLGVAASRMYPGTLADIPGLAPHLANPTEPVPGAQQLRDALLTLPIYPGLSHRQLLGIAASVLRATAEA